MRTVCGGSALAVAVMIAASGCGGHRAAPAPVQYAAPPVPPPGAAPSPSSTPSARAPGAVTLRIKAQFQEGRLYCIPASSAISLGTFGIAVRQRTLARKMDTHAPFGTHGDDAVRVLADYVSPGYTVTNVTDVQNPVTLMRRVVDNVGVLRRAPQIAVWWERLPWNRGLGGHYGHVIVAYGYDARAGTVEVWDPWAATGGRHTLSAKALAKAAQYWGMYFYSRTTSPKGLRDVRRTSHRGRVAWISAGSGHTTQRT
ncbi:C39 family peptidase [Actinomadura fibrosa]|uniref:C39 family peptidase n=1 Tax=Actinomadura fibrosa TaxID=111802 RepID=A0ABW2XR51_9ACTN|nr:C39 family peptidase [Actinomadura fibrosa]